MRKQSQYYVFWHLITTHCTSARCTSFLNNVRNNRQKSHTAWTLQIIRLMNPRTIHWDNKCKWPNHHLHKRFAQHVIRHLEGLGRNLGLYDVYFVVTSVLSTLSIFSHSESRQVLEPNEKQATIQLVLKHMKQNSELTKPLISRPKINGPNKLHKSVLPLKMWIKVVQWQDTSCMAQCYESAYRLLSRSTFLQLLCQIYRIHSPNITHTGQALTRNNRIRHLYWLELKYLAFREDIHIFFVRQIKINKELTCEHRTSTWKTIRPSIPINTTGITLFRAGGNPRTWWWGVRG